MSSGEYFQRSGQAAVTCQMPACMWRLSPMPQEPNCTASSWWRLLWGLQVRQVCLLVGRDVGVLITTVDLFQPASQRSCPSITCVLLFCSAICVTNPKACPARCVGSTDKHHTVCLESGDLDDDCCGLKGTISCLPGYKIAVCTCGKIRFTHRLCLV